MLHCGCPMSWVLLTVEDKHKKEGYLRKKITKKSSHCNKSFISLLNKVS